MPGGTIQTILITGANGFVGSHIARGLSERGFRLHLVDQTFGASSKAYWNQQGQGLLEADARALPPLDAVDAVVHGAFITAHPEEVGLTPEEHYRVNVGSAVAMLEYAKAHNVKRFIFLSSAGVFSPEQTAPLTKTTFPSPKGPYAVAKRAVEELLKTLREKGRDVVTLRLGNLYGPFEHSRSTRPRTSLVQRMVNEAVRTNHINVPNETARDWTFAPDLAPVVDRILKVSHLQHPLYHVVSGEALTALEIAQKIADELPHVTLNLADEQTRLRPPLQSERFGEFGFNDWTRFDDGLERTLAGQLEATL